MENVTSSSLRAEIGSNKTLTLAARGLWLVRVGPCGDNLIFYKPRMITALMITFLRLTRFI